MLANSSLGLVTYALTTCLAKFLLSAIAIDLLWTVVIKTKKIVKKGNVNIRNSATADPRFTCFR
jgi:hypothetical protein